MGGQGVRDQHHAGVRLGPLGDGRVPERRQRERGRQLRAELPVLRGRRRPEPAAREVVDGVGAPRGQGRVGGQPRVGLPPGPGPARRAGVGLRVRVRARARAGGRWEEGGEHGGLEPRRRRLEVVHPQGVGHGEGVGAGRAVVGRRRRGRDRRLLLLDGHAVEALRVVVQPLGAARVALLVGDEVRAQRPQHRDAQELVDEREVVAVRHLDDVRHERRVELRVSDADILRHRIDAGYVRTGMSEECVFFSSLFFYNWGHW